MSTAVTAADITLGLLAGGRGSRLGGVDKAWLQRDGIPQVLRFSRRFPGETGPVLVSANRDLDRHAAAGLTALPDRLPPDSGPLAGIEVILAACTTAWLLTLPVDLFDVNDCLVRSLLAGRSETGAFAEDDDGPQPLVALYRCDALRAALPGAVAANELAPRRLQSVLGLARIRLPGVRFGNLNTIQDLATARIPLPASDTP